MNKRIALILSAVYCGLGQIYKGEKTKGIVFIILYTLIIALLIFYSSFSSIIHIFVLLILILMWCMGMIDTYLEDIEGEESIVDKRRWLILEKVLNTLEIVVIGGVMITLIMATYTGFDKRPAAVHKPSIIETSNEEAVIENPVDEEIITEDLSNEEASNEKPVDQIDISEYFSIQVGAFANLNAANKLHYEMRRKGYEVRIETPGSATGKWNRVLIGKFDTEQNAVQFAERLRRKDGLDYVVVRRRNRK